MTDRPRFRAGLRPVIRRRGELQFGLAPEGVILGGLTQVEAGLLVGLDGTVTRRTSFDRARHSGVANGRWKALLDRLEELDVLERADDVPAGHVPGYVLVDGVGELPRECALLLRKCGIARVSHGRTATDLVVSAPDQDRPDLVVVLGDQVIDPRRGETWLRLGVSHLPVVTAGRSAQVGPVLGSDHSSPCLWCLDLHRTDRDETWPVLMAQLCRGTERRLTGPLPLAELPAGLGQLVSGVVALYAVGLLTGNRPPDGVSAEVSLPWPRMDHRRWPRHPRCDRHVHARSVVA